jgi:hypothetical protein
MALPLPKTKLYVQALEKFATWFASAAGVWQTFLFSVGVVSAEFTGLIHDKNGFWLLYGYTVYSGITQPLLAYVNKLDTNHGEDLLEEILDDVEQITHPASPSKEN